MPNPSHESLKSGTGARDKDSQPKKDRTHHCWQGGESTCKERSSLWESLVSGRKEKGTLALQAQGSQFCQNPMHLEQTLLPRCLQTRAQPGEP